MPMHPDFQKILQNYVRQYGKEKGTEFFYRWLNKHDYDDTKPFPKKGANATYTYGAKLHSPEEYQGKHYAKIRVIDTNVSSPTPPYGDRWKVSYDGLKKALPSLMQAPLIGPPEEGHDANQIIGKPIQYKMPDGYVDVVYEIMDNEAWNRIKNFQWLDVSPQVTATDVEQAGNYSLLNDCRFDHVAWVDEGAFKEAQLQDICEGGKECIHRLSAELFHGQQNLTDGADNPLSEGMQTADEKTNKMVGDSELETYQGANAWDTIDAPDEYFAYVPAGKPKSERKLPLASREKKGYDPAIVRNALARFKQTQLPADAKSRVLAKICRVAKQLGIESELCNQRQGELTMSEQEKTQTETKPEPSVDKMKLLEDELNTMRAELEKKTQYIERLERQEPHRSMQAQLDDLKAENKDLKEWRAAEIEKKQLDVAKDVADLRIQAGFVDERDRITEIERLKKFDGEALKSMRNDVMTVLTEMTGGPKARFKARANTNSDDVHVRMREHLGL